MSTSSSLSRALLTTFLISIGLYVEAQNVSISSDGSTADPSAILEVKASNKGLLIPRISLTGTNDIVSIPSPAASLLIYNLATAGSGSNAVTPGFYFWNSSSWERLSASPSVATSSGSGSVTSGGWGLSGNAGTTSTNFIGTTDNQPLYFRVNSAYAGQLASRNVAFGLNALPANTGIDNVALGNSALSINTSGVQNTALGSTAGTSSADLNNTTAIGYGAVADASNKIRLGNTGVTVIEGQVPFSSPSDGRFKFNIREDIHGLDFIRKLRPVSFQIDVRKLANGNNLHTANTALEASYTLATSMHRSGFIAQEVEQAAHDVNYDFTGIIRPGSEKEHYSLSYEIFVVPLVKAVQEQDQTIARQRKEIDNLKKTLDNLKDLKQEVEDLKQELDDLKKTHSSSGQH